MERKKSAFFCGDLSPLTRFLMVVIFVAAAGAWALNPGAADDAEAVISEAQKLSDAEKFEQANELLIELAQTNPDHPDVYWKTAQNYYDLGERTDIAKDKDKKLDLYVKCEEWARKGFDKNPDLADNAFWMAVGMSQQAQTNGIAATLISDRTLAKKIEDYYLKSSQAKEFHYRDKNSDTISSAYMALGIFYRKIPDSIIVRMLMGTKGDLDKSVENNKKAREMYPASIEYNKELGVSLLCRGNKESNEEDLAEGKKYLQAAIALPAGTALDRIDQEDCRRLMADPSIACGYSRVQQEEVSDQAFQE